MWLFLQIGDSFGMFLYSQRKCVKYEGNIFALERYQHASAECALFNWGSDGGQLAKLAKRPILFIQPNQRIQIVEILTDGKLKLKKYDPNLFTKRNHTHMKLFGKLLNLGKVNCSDANINKILTGKILKRLEVKSGYYFLDILHDILHM